MAKLTLKRADDAGTPDLFSSDSPTEAPSLSRDFIKDLNDVQRDAATSVEGPVLIVAGAGSGKTRVLTYRIAWLLANGVAPWNVLALTFTNKAAGEMKERIGALVGEERARRLWMGTFHSVFSRILRREAEAMGYTSSFSIYDSDDSIGVVRAAMAEFGISTTDYTPKQIHHRISTAKNAMINPAMYRQRATSGLEERVALVYQSYERRLRQNNAMDFDDLLVRTIELFETFPEVLAKYQEQFRYILIDEYQDTNRAQYVVVEMLAAAHGNICVVGDDAQSIYRFRGADIRNILDFERDYPQHKTFRLEQNYRSTQRILAAADEVIRNNRNRIEKRLWTENIEGEKIRVITSRDEREEGEEIVRILQKEERQGIRYSQIAILYRTNSQSLSIEDALRRANIPYALVGGVAFYRRKEVKDALSYLRLAVNPRDDEAFQRTVNTPARGIGETTMKRLRAWATTSGKHLIEGARQPDAVGDISPRIGAPLQRFAELIDRYHASLGSTTLAEFARGLLSDSGLLQSYRDEGTPESVARWDNVQRIISHIAEFSEARPSATLDEYLQEIALLSDADSYDAAAERVTMMTIHAAKGLEFDVVVVAGLEEGLFPVANATQQQEEIEEERRLFYVAVTRARRRLYLTNTERRYRFGELSYPTPSRFLGEIGDEHLEFSSTAPRIPSTPTRPGGGGDGSYGGGQPKRVPIRPMAQKPAFDDGGEGDDYSQIERPLVVGAMVLHPQFGRGRVEMMAGTGDRTKITVRFETVGRKQLMLKFAPLKVVG